MEFPLTRVRDRIGIYSQISIFSKKVPNSDNGKIINTPLTPIMYGLPSPHKSESSSAYDKKGDARTDVVANYL